MTGCRAGSKGVACGWFPWASDLAAQVGAAADCEGSPLRASALPACCAAAFCKRCSTCRMLLAAGRQLRQSTWWAQSAGNLFWPKLGLGSSWRRVHRALAGSPATGLAALAHGHTGKQPAEACP